MTTIPILPEPTTKAKPKTISNGPPPELKGRKFHFDIDPNPKRARELADMIHEKRMARNKEDKLEGRLYRVYWRGKHVRSKLPIAPLTPFEQIEAQWMRATKNGRMSDESAFYGERQRLIACACVFMEQIATKANLSDLKISIGDAKEVKYTVVDDDFNETGETETRLEGDKPAEDGSTTIRATCTRNGDDLQLLPVVISLQLCLDAVEVMRSKYKVMWLDDGYRKAEYNIDFVVVSGRVEVRIINPTLLSVAQQAKGGDGATETGEVLNVCPIFGDVIDPEKVSAAQAQLLERQLERQRADLAMGQPTLFNDELPYEKPAEYCPAAEAALMRNKTKPKAGIWQFACRLLSCPVCGPRRKSQMCQSLIRNVDRFVFAEARLKNVAPETVKLYLYRIDDQHTASFLDLIREHNGLYAKCRAPFYTTVLSTVAINSGHILQGSPGELSATDTVTRFNREIQSLAKLSKNDYSHSHAWKTFKRGRPDWVNEWERFTRPPKGYKSLQDYVERNLNELPHGIHLDSFTPDEIKAILDNPSIFSKRCIFAGCPEPSAKQKKILLKLLTGDYELPSSTLNGKSFKQLLDWELVYEDEKDDGASHAYLLTKKGEELANDIYVFNKIRELKREYRRKCTKGKITCSRAKMLAILAHHGVVIDAEWIESVDDGPVEDLAACFAQFDCIGVDMEALFDDLCAGEIGASKCDGGWAGASKAIGLDRIFATATPP